MCSPTALADLHLDLLYETDERGLILRSRDHDVVVPLVHLVRTPDGNRWLMAALLTDRERSLIHDTLAHEPVVHNIDAMETQPPLLRGLRELLGEQLREYRGPAFAFPNALAVSDVATKLLVEQADAATVPELAWIRSTGAQHQPLCIARNEASEIVAVCHSARSTARAAEAGVETATDYRRRGLASAVVAGWATAVRLEERLPVYSTWWGNTASRALARRLGLLPFGEDVSIG